MSAILAAMPAVLHAQGDVLVGVFGGYGSSTLKTGGTEGLSIGSVGGIAAGAFAVYSLHPNIALEPELFYNRKGASLPALPDAIPALPPSELEIDYITIPVLLRAEVRSGRDGDLRPHAVFGPAYHLSVGCSLTPAAECQYLFIKQNYFSLAFGAGVDYKGLHVQGRYDVGLSNSDRDANFDQLLIVVGYAFRFGGDD